MNYSDLNRYVGRPYVAGGRDIDGLDCYGLCKLVYEEVYGLTLPDWVTDEIDLRGFHDDIQSVVTSGNWTELDKPEDGCFVVCFRAKISHHIGLFFKDGVLHCISEGDRGCVHDPLPRFLATHGRVVYGRWEP